MGFLPVYAAFSLQASVDWVPVYLLCPAQKLLQAVCHLSLGIEGEMVAPILPTMLSHMCAALQALPSVTATPYEPVLRAVQPSSAAIGLVGYLGSSLGCCLTCYTADRPAGGCPPGYIFGWLYCSAVVK